MQGAKGFHALWMYGIMETKALARMAKDVG